MQSGERTQRTRYESPLITTNANIGIADADRTLARRQDATEEE